MIFNSIPFAIFLPLVFILYWFIFNRNLKLQNIFLLAASYFFYGFWDWRFLFLLFGISLLSYLIALKIERTDDRSKRRAYLISGIVIIVGTLAYFKYFNFFIDSFIQFISLLGYEIQSNSLDIILPLGISFYTFLSLSYIIDVYQKKMKASSNPIEALLALSFFPIILAGPIQRPIGLIPQIQRKRVFNYYMATSGLRQILWGLFMKIVIADNCAVNANLIFDNYQNYNGLILLFGGILYSLQIYGDFAGYSDIAIGVAKLFGFELIRNFKYPYFAKDIVEFWKRWHISLTLWFRDYVFLPTSFFLSKKLPYGNLFGINTDIMIYSAGIIVTWGLTGLWHGANYTFIFWGILNGFFLILYKIFMKPRKKLLKKFKIKYNNVFISVFERLFTILLIIISWIIFRSESLIDAFSYINRMFLINIPTNTDKLPDFLDIKTLVILSFFALIVDWLGSDSNYSIEKIYKLPMFIRWAFYLVMFICLFAFSTTQQQFIYFQF
jgi:D-alanyl-lipoteichoic acid acyltransferase DltB (MBOAT superfamily)